MQLKTEFAITKMLIIQYLTMQSDLKRYCLNNMYSILKNMPTPKCVSCGHIVSVLAEEPIKCALLIDLRITIFDPKHIECNMLKMLKNAISMEKGCKKA